MSIELKNPVTKEYIEQEIRKIFKDNDKSNDQTNEYIKNEIDGLLYLVANRLDQEIYNLVSEEINNEY
jgi:hypothetical protein